MVLPTRLDAELLIPGHGEPLKKASVIFEGGVIKWVGTRNEIPKAYHELQEPTESVPVLMPGLWDCHAHFLGAKTASIAGFITNPQATAGARSARDVIATLNAGFTSVRELGGYGVELKQAIEEGWLDGHNIYPAVSPISMKAGHGDGHSLPVNQVNEKFHHGVPFCLCDGVDECLKAVRLQIRRGARILKICATGGATSLIDSPHGAQFSLREIQAVVEEAESADMIVAAHCHGTKGILNAIRAVCKTIEHGSFLTDEAIKLMLEKDVMLISTRSIFRWGTSHPEYLDDAGYRKMNLVEESNAESCAKAVKSGVKVAISTDLGLSGSEPNFTHGTNGRELVYAVEAGMRQHWKQSKLGLQMGLPPWGHRRPYQGSFVLGTMRTFLRYLQIRWKTLRFFQNQRTLRTYGRAENYSSHPRNHCLGGLEWKSSTIINTLGIAS